MAVKLLISAESNAGKTTLTQSLDPKTTLVISHDGKNYPYPIPHVNVDTFATSAQLIGIINDKIAAFEAKLGHYPKTIVIDSVSKVFDTLMDSMANKHTGFKIYSELNKEIHEFTDYVQNVLIANDINVIILSHAIYDSETAKYNLIGKGDFSKRGGWLAETDFAIFLETKNNKRIVHHRSTKFPARTALDTDPDSLPVEEFSLVKYVEKLSSVRDAVEAFIL